MAVIKGVTLALVCVGLAVWKLSASPELEHYNDLRYLTLWTTGLSIIALVGGATLGALAYRLRSDRVLVLVGAALGGVSLVHTLVIGHPPSERAAQVLVLPGYLVVGIAGVVLAWWTRPAPILPTARIGRRWFPRPRWRYPTTVEMAVAIAIATAFVIAIGVGQTRRPAYSYWYKHTPIVDGGNFWLLVCALIAIAIPCGVTIGLVARIPLFPKFFIGVATLICVGLASIFVRSLGPLAFPAWSWGAVAAGAIALAQYHRGNATSRDAGNTSTTP